jgi:hypothetical protein
MSVKKQLNEISRSQRELSDRVTALSEQLGAALSGDLPEIRRRLERAASTDIAETRQLIAAVNRTVNSVHRLAKSQRDEIPRLIARLGEARREPDYERVWEEPDPLVTVRIASYQRTDDLMNIALRSVLAQSHQNLEIIIVNDGPNPETAAAVKELNDDRITYSEFAHRFVYPEPAAYRWYVAGSPGMNEGIRRARGAWIAPLDEDDEFTENHIERLLSLARETRAEVAYGALIQRDLVEKTESHVFSYPPNRGGFSFQGALVHGALRFFEYDQESWLVAEPGDWNLARRMLAAGVRMAGVDEVVATLNWTPYTHKDPEAG